MKRLKKIVLMLTPVLLIGGVSYYLLGTGDTAESQTPAGQVQRVVKVTVGDLYLNVSANGVVQPINRVEVKSKASGQIEQITFEEGQYVSRGDLLLALDQTTARNDYEQAKADLAVQEANLAQAENNWRRAMELFEKKLISEQERDQVNLEYVRAQSQLIKAKAILSSAEERLRDTRIVAPISGIILTKNVELGQIISSGVTTVGGGTLLATLADMDQVYVETNVDEVDIGKVAVGQNAKVVADAFPDQTFTGEVIRIAPLGKTQQNVTTFNVIILVRNIGGRLKAGMSASVDIEIFNRKQVLLVPNEALKDPQSEQGRMMLASLRQEEGEVKVKPDSVKATSADKATAEMDFDALRQRMQNMSPEERRQEFQKMRERFESMSPEERERVRAQMGQRFGGQGGGGTMQFRMGDGGGMSGGQGSAARPRRMAQVGNIQEVKRRVLMVKEGDTFVPRIVTVGASNFDYSEVLSGLKEGDEIQITTISRAKLASEQFNERMRSMQSVGGLGATRVPGATGSRR